MGVLLLFPGFFFYHTLVAFGYLPAVLGGYYGSVSLLFLALGIPLMLYGFRRRYLSVDRIDVAFVLLSVFVVIWAVIHWRFGNFHQRDPELLTQSLSGVALWTVSYVLFRGFSPSRRHVLVFMAATAGMIVIAGVNAESGFFYARQLADDSGSDIVSTYQGFSRSAVVMLMILLGAASNRWLPWIYLAGLGLLFLLGARSEFAGFLLVGILAIYLRVGLTRFALLAVPVLALGLWVLLDLALEVSVVSRIFRLLEYQTDNSFNERMYLSDRALADIGANPFIGSYGGYLVYSGIGGYAHNALSAWHNFGLIGFVGFVYLIFQSLRTSLPTAMHAGTRSPESVLAALMAVFVAVLAVAAKSMFFPLFAAAWALAAGLSDKRRSSIVDPLRRKRAQP
jgi:hypothetical protein